MNNLKTVFILATAIVYLGCGEKVKPDNRTKDIEKVERKSLSASSMLGSGKWTCLPPSGKEANKKTFKGDSDSASTVSPSGYTYWVIDSKKGKYFNCEKNNVWEGSGDDNSKKDELCSSLGDEYSGVYRKLKQCSFCADNSALGPSDCDINQVSNLENEHIDTGNKLKDDFYTSKREREKRYQDSKQDLRKKFEESRNKK